MIPQEHIWTGELNRRALGARKHGLVSDDEFRKLVNAG
jgi:hypothetical protein